MGGRYSQDHKTAKQNKNRLQRQKRVRYVWFMRGLLGLTGVIFLGGGFLAFYEKQTAEAGVLSEKVPDDRVLVTPTPKPAVTAPVVTPVPERSASEPKDGEAAADSRLILVNSENAVPPSFSVSLVPLDNNQFVDEQCYPDLQEMLDACTAKGLSPVVCSSYRTSEKQQSLFDAQVDKFIRQGLKDRAARAEAVKSVALPGFSEHQLGLAVDIVDKQNQNLDHTQESTEVQQWLLENSWKYGFILRYPNGKSEITGIIYEPWHYRYVGRETAEEIQEQDVCLEEYLENNSMK